MKANRNVYFAEVGVQPEDFGRATASGCPAEICSAAQLRFWMLDQISPRNPALNVAVRWRLEGYVVHADIERAFQMIVERHDVLRTSFEARDGSPRPVIERRVDFRVPLIDLSHLPLDRAEESAEQLARTEARACFDLSVAPLFRVSCLRLSDRATIVLVTAHHVILDGWSVGLLAREMGEICAAAYQKRAPQLPALEVTYGEFAQWQAEVLDGASLELLEAYWKKALAGIRYFELPTDRMRPKRATSSSRMTSLLLERRRTDALAALGRRHGCTTFTASLAVLLALLHRYSGETDIAIGTQVAGRDEPDLEPLVGLFINTLVLRTDLSENPSFEVLLARVRRVVEDALEHQLMPLEHVIELVRPERDPSRNALFAVNFIFQRSFVSNEDYGPFRLIDLPSCATGAIYDLNIFMVERPDGWRLSCEYNVELFEASTVDGLLRHFGTLLDAAVADPTQPVSRLYLLDDEEQRRASQVVANTSAEYPADKTLPELFAAQVDRTPDAVALLFGERSLSYRKLESLTTRIEQMLRQRQLPPGSRIGIFLHRSPELVAGLMAVLRCGCAYVPLDPMHPVERLAQVFENAELSALLSSGSLIDRLPATEALTALIDIDQLPPEGSLRRRLGGRPSPGAIAYVIYTSGSTGIPKGVQVSHRALVNLLWSMRAQPGLGAGDSLLALTTIAFDIAGLELFLPLVTGARVVLAHEDETKSGADLNRLIERHQVTVMQATPSTWHLLLEAGWDGERPLKMLCGGETLSRQLADRLLATGGELWNMYGPSETTIWSAVEKVGPGSGPVLIGPPIANTQFYVLDAHRRLVAPGAPGELYVGGDGVAEGYLNLPEATAERFIPDPFRRRPDARLYRTGDRVRQRAGNRLEFLGRADHQIKLRGFRIELGEIEALLMRRVEILDVVCVVRKNALDEDAIIAYVVQRGPRDVIAESQMIESLRASLRAALPKYMHPESILVLDVLPRTPNGKIDRQALPAPQRLARPSAFSTTPQNQIEQRLEKIWCTVLGLPTVARDANFFEIGGHSLLAARLSARIEAEFGQRLSLANLFKSPTIETQQQLLGSDNQREFEFRQAVRLHPNGRKTPIIAINNTGVYYYQLSKKLGSDQPLTALQLFDPSISHGPVSLRSIEDIASDYVSLIREFQPLGPYRLIGWCLGGVLAFEVARQLVEDGREVSLLGLIDTWAPGHLKRLSRPRAILADLSYRWQIIYSEWLRYGVHGGGIREFLIHRNVVKRLLGLIGKAPPVTKRPDLAEAEALGGESYDFWLLNYLTAVAESYEPKPYNGTLSLLRSSREPGGPFLDFFMGWGRFSSRPIEVSEIEGDHFTVFRDPGLGQLADCIRETERSNTQVSNTQGAPS